MENEEITVKILKKRAEKQAQKPKLACKLLKEIKEWQNTGKQPSDEAMNYYKFLNNKKA